MVFKIISGGQTGVDRAALDAAIELNIPHGGYCPKGRRAEDGIIHENYNLMETDSELYSERTLKNVKESNGSLILFWEIISGGTLTTLELCRSLDKPCLPVDMDKSPNNKLKKIKIWIQKNQIQILNVAGPRQDGSGVYLKAKDFLLNVFSEFLILKGNYQY